MANTCSIDELKSHPGNVIKQVQSSKEPLYIDQNGTASVLLLDADVYLTQMQALAEFKRIYLDGVPGKPQEAALAAAAAAAAAVDEKDKGAGDASPAVPTVQWRCKVCGYIVEIDELPDDFVCPVCGVGKEMFEKVEG